MPYYLQSVVPHASSRLTEAPYVVRIDDDFTAWRYVLNFTPVQINQREFTIRPNERVANPAPDDLVKLTSEQLTQLSGRAMRPVAADVQGMPCDNDPTTEGAEHHLNRLQTLADRAPGFPIGRRIAGRNVSCVKHETGYDWEMDSVPMPRGTILQSLLNH